MKFASLATILVLAASIAAASTAQAAGRDEEGIDKSAADAFDGRMFGVTPAKKSYACFVRKYDSAHLAQHPKQKVSTMKLLMTAEIPSDASTFNYSFRLGVKYRNRSTNFESFGDCGHVVAEDTGQEVRFGCGVDCDGGGLGVALAKDDKSAVVQLERVRIWRRNTAPEETAEDLGAGADDKKFRLDRTELRDCAELVTDRKELAELKRK
ncbi:hypothetical protein [Afipia sp. GAS231]|uniref:hypothetical protein n=1 Tax=Afipia sp. GAS231 TaxID=1882747 RepID=UPI00087CFE41|nr:hypothetical protein [Afipia sp. GAS231]SDN67518.1 hypothetical protein SAMN05444050_2142 [Afipia sp. GAS231]